MKKDRIYLLLTLFAKEMGVDSSAVYRWVAHGHIEPYLVGGQQMILRKEAEKLMREWYATCTQADAAREIGIPQGTISGYIKQGILKSKKMFGINRIVSSSIPRGKKHASSKAQRLHKHAVHLGKHGGGHRFTSKELREWWRKKKLAEKSGGKHPLVARRGR